MERTTLTPADFDYVIVWKHDGQTTQLPAPSSPRIKKKSLALRIIQKIFFVSLKKTFGF